MSHLKITPCGTLILSAASSLAENIKNKMLHKGDRTPQATVACGKSAMCSWQAVRTGLSQCKKATIRSMRAVTGLAPKPARGARPATNRVEEHKTVRPVATNPAIQQEDAANVVASPASPGPWVAEADSDCSLECEQSAEAALEGCDPHLLQLLQGYDDLPLRLVESVGPPATPYIVVTPPGQQGYFEGLVAANRHNRLVIHESRLGHGQVLQDRYGHRTFIYTRASYWVRLRSVSFRAARRAAAFRARWDDTSFVHAFEKKVLHNVVVETPLENAAMTLGMGHTS